MKYWVTPEEMTEFDRRAIKNGTLGDVLMERAGTSAARAAMKMTSIEDGTVIVFAGPGNNGGDGLVLARILHERSFSVCVVLVTVTGKSLSRDCQTNLVRYTQNGGTVLSPKKMHELPDSAGLVVDALLGTGFRGSIRY